VSASTINRRIQVKVLITLMGPSNWGLFNSIWGAIRFHGFTPDRIHIMGSKRDHAEFKNLKKMLVPLLNEYGSAGDVRFEEVSVGRVDDVYKKVSRTLDEEEQDNEMALDITPGRKAMVLGSLLAGWKDGKMSRFEHVFYLYIESLRNASRPFMLIPMSVQRCHDIPRESRGPEIEF
jgi:hypothetical protein